MTRVIIDGVAKDITQMILNGADGTQVTATFDAGGDSYIDDVKTGTFKPNADINNEYVVNHGCHSAPNYIIVESDGLEVLNEGNKPTNSTITKLLYDAQAGFKIGQSINTVLAVSNSARTTDVNEAGFIKTVNDVDFSIWAGGNRLLDHRLTYRWTAVHFSREVVE